MKVLLLADDPKIGTFVRKHFRGTDATLIVRGNRQGLSSYVSAERPRVIIDTLMEPPDTLNLEEFWLPQRFGDEEILKFDLGRLSLDAAGRAALEDFLRTLPLSPNPASPFVVRGGKATIRPASRPSKRVASKANAAHRAMVEAKEILAGIASLEDRAVTSGNKARVPLSNEALRTIDRALDAGIALADSPTISRESAPAIGKLVRFFKDAEVALKQVEKTVTAGVKVAGVLAVLASAMAVVASKLGELLTLLVG